MWSYSSLLWIWCQTCILQKEGRPCWSKFPSRLPYCVWSEPTFVQLLLQVSSFTLFRNNASVLQPALALFTEILGMGASGGAENGGSAHLHISWFWIACFSFFLTTKNHQGWNQEQKHNVYKSSLWLMTTIWTGFSTISCCSRKSHWLDFMIIFTIGFKQI